MKITTPIPVLVMKPRKTKVPFFLSNYVADLKDKTMIKVNKI